VRDTVLSFFEPPLATDQGQDRTKILWLVRLRWIALSAQVLSIVPALHFEILEQALVPYFAGIVAALALLNVATWWLLRSGLEGSPGVVLFQLGADITALSSLLALTGGAWNPMVPILFVHTGIGALLLQGRLSLIFFALLIACLVMIQLGANIPPGLEGNLLPAVVLFPAQLVVAIVFWILTAWLSRTLTALQSHFAFLSERRTRVDRLRAVGALAAGLSHELATPLNTAQLKLRRLARTRELRDDPDLRTASEALERCGEVLHHMVGSQMEPERIGLDRVDVDELVQRVCRSLARDHEGARIRFESEGRGSRHALIPDIAFSQALVNLIDNAVESAGADEPVDVRVETRSGRIEVSVMDRGRGWPDVVRRHLGEPFVTTKPDGVGLGLYFVHNLAEAVGASLILEDRDQGGAVARISLPTTATAEA